MSQNTLHTEPNQLPNIAQAAPKTAQAKKSAKIGIQGHKSKSSKPYKKTPSKVDEMERAFLERYYPGQYGYNSAGNSVGAQGTSNGASGQNGANSGGASKQNNSNTQNSGGNSGGNSNSNGQNNQNSQNGLDNLSQMAPILGLLGGNKNPQITNLLSAFGNGNMDMNKLINTISKTSGVNSMGSDGGDAGLPNILNLLGGMGNSGAPKKTPLSTANKTSNIKNMPRV